MGIGLNEKKSVEFHNGEMNEVEHQSKSWCEDVEKKYAHRANSDSFLYHTVYQWPCYNSQTKTVQRCFVYEGEPRFCTKYVRSDYTPYKTIVSNSLGWELKPQRRYTKGCPRQTKATRLIGLRLDLDVDWSVNIVQAEHAFGCHDFPEALHIAHAAADFTLMQTISFQSLCKNLQGLVDSLHETESCSKPVGAAAPTPPPPPMEADAPIPASAILT